MDLHAGAILIGKCGAEYASRDAAVVGSQVGGTWGPVLGVGPAPPVLGASSAVLGHRRKPSVLRLDDQRGQRRSMSELGPEIGLRRTGELRVDSGVPLRG